MNRRADRTREIQARRNTLRRKAELKAKCRTGKRRYRTEQQAIEAMQAIQQMADGRKKPARSYLCEHCAGWHLSSLPSFDDTPRKPLRPRSAKTAHTYRRERVPLVAELLDGGAACAIRWDDKCAGRADTVHELKKRSRGGSITDRANTIPACAYCNGKVEDEPAEAHRRGFALHSWESTT